MGSQLHPVHQHKKTWAGWCEILAFLGVQTAQPSCLHSLLDHRFVLSLWYKAATSSLWKNEQGLFFFFFLLLLFPVKHITFFFFLQIFGNFYLFYASPFPAQCPNLWDKGVSYGELYTLLPLHRLTKQQMKFINFLLPQHFGAKEKLLTMLLAAWFYLCSLVILWGLWSETGSSARKVSLKR